MRISSRRLDAEQYTSWQLRDRRSSDRCQQESANKKSLKECQCYGKLDCVVMRNDSVHMSLLVAYASQIFRRSSWDLSEACNYKLKVISHAHNSDG